MPELPEVEHIRRRIASTVGGKRLLALQVPDESLLKNCTEEALREGVVDRSLTDVRRRGKYLLFHFEEYTLVNHLRMSGRWLEEEQDRTRLSLQFTGEQMLFMDDLRRLGTAHLFETETVSEQPPIADLGVEPLSSSFTTEALSRLCTTSREVKRLLLDQHRMAGIGNIYACEALHHGAIHPEREADSLIGEEVQRLHTGIRETLRTAIRNEGTSFDQLYRTPSGQPGQFQHQLRVYDREGDRCGRCGEPVQRMKQGQRSTYYCPGCQVDK